MVETPDAIRRSQGQNTVLGRRSLIATKSTVVILNILQNTADDLRGPFEAQLPFLSFLFEPFPALFPVAVVTCPQVAVRQPTRGQTLCRDPLGAHRSPDP